MSGTRTIDERLAEITAKRIEATIKANASSAALHTKLNSVEQSLNETTSMIEEWKKRKAKKNSSQVNNSSATFNSVSTSSLGSSHTIPSVTSIPLMPTPSSYTPAGKKY